MHHFRTKITSPLLSICTGYIYIVALAVTMYYMKFYDGSTFFSWGTPVTFMGTKVTNQGTYYLLLLLFFGHQLINNWINDVTYPWIINCVQDPKCDNLLYSKRVSLLIVNMFALYSELDVILIISGVMSQISFFLMIILANLISTSIINWEYIRNKPEITTKPSLENYRYLTTP